MKISVFKRISKAYLTIGVTFGTWFSPIFTGLFISVLRIVVGISRMMDRIFFPGAFKSNIKNPIIIVGNPRSGTTFLHRYLVRNKIGVGSQLWQMLYPSILLQKMLRPVLPFLEKISPARHHSTVAHKTSLQSVETDDVALFSAFWMDFSFMDLFCHGQRKISLAG